MPIRRLFVDWHRPLLPQVADDLLRNAPAASMPDLSHLIVVVPVRRAARRLRELLADRTGGAHVPPRIVTVGDLPELLYEPQRPFAVQIVQKLAWVSALQGLSAERAQKLLKTLPGDGDLQSWLSLAELLHQQHRELAADGLDFRDVLRAARTLSRFSEHERWSVLADLQQAYLRSLDDLDLWDVQTARIVAVRQREIQTDRDIILVGMSDLNRIDRAVLDRVADRVTAYIHAPETLAACFDPHGCVVAQEWAERTIELAADQVIVAADPGGQVQAVARILMDFDGAHRADEITIGLASDQLAPHLRRTLSEYGLTARWGVGTPLEHSAPCRLLAAVADYLEDDRTSNFTTLVRHPDITDWLGGRKIAAGWLNELDAFIADHIPHRIADWVRRRAAPRVVGAVFRQVDELISPLCGRARPLSDWAAPVLKLLTTVYEQTSFDPHEPSHQAVLKACESLQSILAEHALVPRGLVPSTSAAKAIQLILRDMAGRHVPPPSDPDALNLTGWLDLATDDAPVALIVGVNEGLIPQSSNADPFLPNSLRSALGITDNARRYARDAHALSAVLHSRRHVRLIAARRDSRGDPLAPSRLLLAADAETVARRVQAFYGGREANADQVIPAPLTPRAAGSGFSIPRPRPEAEPVTVLRVTMFRDYIASPYRFYLRHVEGLDEMDDAVDELSAIAFGNLVHEALKLWGQSDCRDATDPETIRRFLSQALDDIARACYGPEPVMAVEVQLEQARARVAAFARWQAGRAAEGWRIRFTEKDVEAVRFDLPDGRSVQLKGRIDRIDYHPAQRRWTIFDYKTGETIDTPERAHRRNDDWIDLQLPLYRHLARPLGVTGDVQLGYIRLPRDTNDVGEKLAEWSDDDLAAADRMAQDVAQRILDARFWEELPEAPSSLIEYGPICQEGVFGVKTFV